MRFVDEQAFVRKREKEEKKASNKRTDEEIIMNIQAKRGGFVHKKKNFSTITFYRCTVLCFLPCTVSCVCLFFLVQSQRYIQRLIFRSVLNSARFYYKRKSKRKEMSVVRAVLAPLNHSPCSLYAKI